MNLLSREDLRVKYQGLTKKYEGYIQLSGGRIEDIFKTPTLLPSWEELEKRGGFIFEMVLYSPDTKKSILVRQINGGWSWIEQDQIDWESTPKEDREIFYSVFDKHSKRELKMVQIWEKREDPISNFEVMEFVGLFFAGFKR